MILIPQRLFDTPGVTTILRDGNVCILQKELSQAVVKREGYISNHVISMVLAGEQRMEKALTILNEQEVSVTELAQAIGYDNTSYFIRESKNKVGLSPKQYMLSQHRNRLKN